VSVVLFGGNHDWWVGRSIAEEYGIQVHHGPLWLETGGKRLYIDHGDGLGVSNHHYGLVRGILHHPCAIRAFAFLHPDWGAWMARLVNRGSNRRNEAERSALQRVPVFEAIANEVFAAGADIAVFGHVHAARIEVRRDGLLVVLGDWISLGTYGELTDGVFHLRTWRAPDLPPWPAS
jgi:UDP-2,3-diacylglucosamine hydrolase